MLKTVFSVAIVVALAGSFFTVLYLISSDEPELKSALFFESQGAEQSFLTPTGKDTVLSAVAAPPQQESRFDWTIVGSIFDPGSELDSLAWWEPIGDNLDSWELKQPLKVSTVSQKFEALAVLPDLQVAVGSEGTGKDSVGFAWYRTEPGEWREADSKSLTGVDELLKVDISPFKEVVAISRKAEDGKQVYEIWFSRDAVDYKQIDISLPEGTILTDIAAGTAGFVATGIHERSDGIVEGIVRVSRDGVNWIAPQSDIFSQEQNIILSGVSANEQGYVIVGGVNDGIAYSPMAWVAEEVEIWTPEGIFFDEGQDDGHISSRGHSAGGVATTSDGFTAFSDVGFLQQIWRSKDGRGWGEVGYIRGHRNTGIPVQDIAMVITGSDITTISAVAIASDTGIWTYSSDTSWKELSFGIEGDDVLYRIEDGPIIFGAAWDPKGNRFIAAGTFSHARGEGSEITNGGRFWESKDSGMTWEFLDQFHIQDLGGPVYDIKSGDYGMAAAGVQDMALAYYAVEAALESGQGSVNPNPVGLFWKLDTEGRWEQFKPLPDAADFPNLTGGNVAGGCVENLLSASSLAAVTPTPDGFIMGGWAFYGIASNIDGLIYIYREPEESASADSGECPYKLIAGTEIGLSGEQDNQVVELCTKLDAESDAGYSTVLFGSTAKEAGEKISSAVTFDGGDNWDIGVSSGNSFDGSSSQQVTSCISVPNEVCSSGESIFTELEPCRQAEDFYLAVGFAVSEGESDARAWWSIRGENWEVLNLPDPLSGAGNQDFAEVIASEEGILIIGNDDSTGINLGQLWIEQNGRLEQLETGFEASSVAVNFYSGAADPEGNIVLVGIEDSRLPRIWHSREPILKLGTDFKVVVEPN